MKSGLDAMPLFLQVDMLSTSNLSHPDKWPKHFLIELHLEEEGHRGVSQRPGVPTKPAFQFHKLTLLNFVANDGIQLTKLLTQKIFLKANDVRVAKVMLFQDKILSPKMRLYVKYNTTFWAQEVCKN